MLRPITSADLSRHEHAKAKASGLLSYVLSFLVIAVMAGNPFFMADHPRLFGLFFVCIFAATWVVSVLKLLIALWLGRLNVSILRYLSNDDKNSSKAATILLKNFWQHELVLQVFSVVATVAAAVWGYQSLVPVVESW